MPASRPTFPSEPQPRRLGRGGGPGGGERLHRTQLVIATILGLTLLSVILYLWRRPTGSEHDDQEGAASASANAPEPAPSIIRTKVEPPKPKPIPRVALAPVQRLKCGASARQTSNESSLCDSLPFFEQALTKAIADTVDCAPKSKEEGSINYVLVAEFRTHEVRVYPGRSGSFHGKQAKAAAQCVKRAIPAPVWDTLSHQYRYYMMSVLATYPVQPAAADGLPNFQ